MCARDDLLPGRAREIYRNALPNRVFSIINAFCRQNEVRERHGTEFALV